MARVVGVHGIWQEFKGAETLRGVWEPAIRDGLTAAQLPQPSGFSFSIAYYGDVFREPGTMALGLPPVTMAALKSDWEMAVVKAWYQAAAEIDERVPKPDEETMFVRTPRFVQTVVGRLSRARFFTALGGERALIWLVKQAYGYVHEPQTRQRILERLVAGVDQSETRVVIGHSLGSVVAYEALCAHPEWDVDTLITLGSPLGMSSFFDYLQPSPVEGKGRWPNVRRWVNVADEGDPVALVKELRPLFATSPDGGQVEDRRVHNGWKSHESERYLNTRQVGEAIGHALA